MLQVGHFFGLVYNVAVDQFGNTIFIVATEDGERSAAYDAKSHAVINSSLLSKERELAKSFIEDFGEDFLSDFNEAKSMSKWRL